MAIVDSELYQEVVNLINARDNVSDTRLRYQLEIIVNDLRIDVVSVDSIAINRDFILSHRDYITLLIKTTRYDYHTHIYPNRDDLKAQLTVISTDHKKAIDGTDVAAQLFTAKLNERKDESLAFGDTIGTNAGAHTQELKEFAIELSNDAYHNIQTKKIEGIVVDTKVDDLIMFALAENSTLGIDMWAPDRQTPVGQLVIPKGTSVIDFPNWVQTYGGGVYNNNINTYYLKDYVYVYPLYDTVPKYERRKVVICLAGPGQLDGIDNTYRIEEGKLSILSTGNVEVRDVSEDLEFTQGNGVAFTLPNFLGDAITHKNGVTTYDAKDYKEHGLNKDTFNNVVTVNPVTNNPHYEVSRVASNRGIVASILWTNANPNVIIPNMEVTLLFKSGDQVQARYGVITGMNYLSEGGSNEGINPTHQGTAELYVFLEKE